MSLRIVYGRAGSGKTYYCLKEIKDKIENHAEHPLILLVPEQYTFQAERDLIKVLETGGILKTEVLSFRRLAFRIFNEAGGITYPHIHSAGKNMLIYRVLDELRKDLKVFAKAAKRKGFVNTIATLITELKRYSVTPEELQKVVDGLQEEDSLKSKLSEINLIYSEFQKNIAERYRDIDDDLTIAAEKMNDTDLYQGAEVWIDGFAGFTPQEYKIIAKLLLKAQRVSICLSADSLMEVSMAGTDVFSGVKAAYGKLEKLCKEIGVEIEPSVGINGLVLPRFKDSTELAHLEQNFASFPYKTFTAKTNDIALFSSVSIFAEIEAAAQDIVRLCRDQGMRYKDIAVVTGNLGSYGRLIEVIFEEYEIPCFLDQKAEIVDHPLVKMILAMLEIFTENWSYEAVFRYLKTGLTGIRRESIDRIENYVLACGIRGSRWTKDESWKMIPELLPNEQDVVKYQNTLEELNQIRSEILRPLLQFRERTRRRDAAEICAALYDFLREIDVPSRIEGTVDEFQKNKQWNLANEYMQVWNIVMDVLDQTVEVMGQETIGLDKFTETLRIGFGEYQVGLIPASLDQVLVGSVERSKSHEIKALYILGVNDGVFPSSVLEEGILSDHDRKTLQNLGVELASDTRTKVFDEQYLVYRALTTPTSYLRLSWPIADQEGRSMRSSIIISRLRRIFPNILETSNIQKPASESEEAGHIAGRSPVFRQLVAAMRQRADGQEISSIWPEVYHWFAEQEEWQLRMKAMRTAFASKNIAQQVSRDKILALYGSPAYTSVSRLEKYTGCPFSYYLQYGLGAKERKIYRLSPPDVGTFMHAVIERFSRDVTNLNISWRDFDRKWCEEKVSLIVEEMIAKMQGSGLAASQRYTALTVRLKRVITRAIWLIAEHIRRSGFEPLGYELGFGEGEKFPPIKIELSTGEQINLIGRIDRVDALKTEEGTYLRIVDYKSGNKDFKLADVYYGLQVQLITYLDALWENSGSEIEAPVLPGGILYFHIDDPMVKSNGKLSEEQIEKEIMKELKMKGLLLADVKLIKEMDKEIDGASLIIPARINKGDVLGKSSAASLEQFQILRKYVKQLLTGLCAEILKGNVTIQPYKKKSMTSCKYCSFSAVCRFDATLSENNYKVFHDRKDEEVWSLLREGEE